MPRFLIVLDVDSTLIEDEVIELLADAAGSRDQVEDVTSRAMAGELDFAASLAARVATLEGLPQSVFADVRSRLTPTRGVRELVDGIHAAGGLVGVVSGGFHETLDPLADDLGLDFRRANRLELRDGRLTGRVSGPVIDAHAKAVALREWAEEARVAVAHTVAVGDGANDLEMMAAAALSVAFNAKPRVRERADVVVGTNDLSQLLPLLGLRG
ncbi:phosphoserine phosphatase SerB [Frigoribacterium sp. PhB24]|uniref:phosphoserine phosphatase SerB n=1 Tax=Frigoribacterium sp. PhB24 TaxID=2485204 RepID=UPI000F4A89A1|nr:phosphoserine phosphatase SerB [Frigoribacterium sp. PhB24]ROS54326.1 phosphoserine phosphatase [Frigoribacterium sp. PhB24]